MDDPEGSSFASFTFFAEMSLSELLSDSEAQQVDGGLAKTVVNKGTVSFPEVGLC